MTCDYLLGVRKSPGLQRKAETETVRVFQTGKTHILVVVAGAAGKHNCPQCVVGLVIAFDEFERLELEQISKYVRNSHCSLILMIERHKAIEVERFIVSSSIATKQSQNHFTEKKHQCHTTGQVEESVHSMLPQAGPQRQPSQGLIFS